MTSDFLWCKEHRRVKMVRDLIPWFLRSSLYLIRA